MEEEHSKLTATVTTRKTILSERSQVIDGKHLLTMPEILNGLTQAENKTKKKKRTASKNDKNSAKKVVREFSEESEPSQDESLNGLDCIN